MRLALLVLFWCYSGANLVLFWCKSGAILVQFWCYSGVIQVLFWCYSGAILVLIGPILESTELGNLNKVKKALAVDLEELIAKYGTLEKHNSGLKDKYNLSHSEAEHLEQHSLQFEEMLTHFKDAHTDSAVYPFLFLLSPSFQLSHFEAEHLEQHSLQLEEILTHFKDAHADCRLPPPFPLSLFSAEPLRGRALGAALLTVGGDVNSFQGWPQGLGRHC
eukprot:gene23564-9088_t